MRRYSAACALSFGFDRTGLPLRDVVSAVARRLAAEARKQF